MMPQFEEWDWPPPRHSRAKQIELDSRIVQDQIVLPRKVPYRPQASRLANRAANAFASAIFALFRLALILALCGVLAASLFLLSAILKA